MHHSICYQNRDSPERGVDRVFIDQLEHRRAELPHQVCNHRHAPSAPYCETKYKRKERRAEYPRRVNKNFVRERCKGRQKHRQKYLRAQEPLGARVRVYQTPRSQKRFSKRAEEVKEQPIPHRRAGNGRHPRYSKKRFPFFLMRQNEHRKKSFGGQRRKNSVCKGDEREPCQSKAAPRVFDKPLPSALPRRRYVFYTVHYFIRSPGTPVVSNKAKGVSAPPTASIIAWLSSPIIILGSKLVTKRQRFPTSDCGSGKYALIPDRTCRSSAPKFTLSFSSLSLPSIFSTKIISPIFISTFLKSSTVIIYAFYPDNSAKSKQPPMHPVYLGLDLQSVTSPPEQTASPPRRR